MKNKFYFLAIMFLLLQVSVACFSQEVTFLDKDNANVCLTVDNPSKPYSKLLARYEKKGINTSQQVFKVELGYRGEEYLLNNEELLGWDGLALAPFGLGECTSPETTILLAGIAKEKNPVSISVATQSFKSIDETEDPSNAEAENLSLYKAEFSGISGFYLFYSLEVAVYPSGKVFFFIDGERTNGFAQHVAFLGYFIDDITPLFETGGTIQLLGAKGYYPKSFPRKGTIVEQNWIR